VEYEYEYEYEYESELKSNLCNSKYLLVSTKYLVMFEKVDLGSVTPKLACDAS
jgi:hypothetical protein